MTGVDSTPLQATVAFSKKAKLSDGKEDGRPDKIGFSVAHLRLARAVLCIGGGSSAPCELET